MPRAWRAGLPSCCAALKVRPAAVAERKPPLVALEERALDLLADADAVEQVGAGEAVERAQAEAHAALGDAPASVSVVRWVRLGSARVGSCRRGAGVCRLASRTAKSISSPLAGAGELDRAPAAGSACGSAPRPRTRRAGGLERRQAAGLRPHPVRDRRREAERLRGQRVHVDRVAVAGDGGVAAAEVAGEPPLGARPEVVGRPRRERARPAGARSLAAASPLAAAQDRADALPDELARRPAPR